MRGQPVANLANETHTTANYILMVIKVSFSLGYVATSIFNKMHSSNKFISPYSTANNAFKSQSLHDYALKDCCALLQKNG